MVLDTRDELESPVSLDYHGRETVALTDAQYVGGQGVADCLDALVLAYLTQHLTNQRFDAALGRGGVTRRYIPHLCYLRGDELIGLSAYVPQNSMDYRRVVGAWNSTGDFPRVWLNEEEVMAVLSEEIPLLIETVNRRGLEAHRCRERRARALSAEWRSPMVTPLRRREIDDELRELAKTPYRSTNASDIKLERRWLLDRSHPELYQQSRRKLFGKVPSWVYYASYNQLRRVRQATPTRSVEDPYAGGRPDLLAGDSEGEVQIGQLDEFGLATLAEYRCARDTLHYAQSHEWYQEMCRRAAARRLDSHKIDAWVERHSFWITPSGQAEFTATLQNKLRGAFVDSDDPLWGRGVPTRSAQRETAFSHRAPVSQIADRLCEIMNSFSHIEHGYVFTGKAIDWGSSSVVYPTIEELRDLVRDNENFAQTRASVSAYDAGLLGADRAGRARDAGLGGRRGACLWWHDPKFKLLWCLHRRRVRQAGGSYSWDMRRFTKEEEAISDPSAREEAHQDRRAALMHYAITVNDPERERRPSDSAVFARLLARKAAISAGSDKIAEAARKATTSDGYRRSELLDDLGTVLGDYPNELGILRVELAWFIDPREVMSHHRGAWSWYLVSRQNFRTRILDKTIDADRGNFGAHPDFLRAIFQRQRVGPFLETIDHAIRHAESDRVVDTLTPIRRVYEEYPDESEMLRGIRQEDGTSILVPFEFNGRRLGGRDDIEKVIQAYRRRAILSMRRRAAEMTYTLGARSFSNSMWQRWRDDGWGWRVGDVDWSVRMRKEMARQAYLSGVFDAKFGQAEVASVWGWTSTQEVEWQEEVIASRKMDAFEASGKYPGGKKLAAMLRDGAAVIQTQIDWVSRWIRSFAFAEPGSARAWQDATYLADYIMKKTESGQWLHDQDAVHGETCDVLFHDRHRSLGPIEKEQVDAVIEVMGTVRDSALWP